MAKKKSVKKTTKKVTSTKKKAVATKGAKKKTPVKKKANTSKKASNNNSNGNTININIPKAPKKETAKGKGVVLAILAILVIIAGIFAYTAYQPIQTEEGVAQANDLAITITSTTDGVDIQTTPTGKTLTIGKEDITYLTELFKTNGYEPTQDELIQEAVVRKVLLENAQDITVDTDVIDQLTSNQAFTQRVQEAGYTVEEFIELFRGQLEKDLRIQEYFNQEIATKIPGQESYETSHILICYQGAQSCAENRTKEEARAFALVVLNDVKNNNSAEYFAGAAQEFSDGPSSVNGGYLGPVTPGVMIPAFEEETFSLAEGEISDIVETEFGFHIIRVSEITQTPNQQALVTALTELRQKIVQEAEATTLSE